MDSLAVDYKLPALSEIYRQLEVEAAGIQDARSRYIESQKNSEYDPAIYRLLKTATLNMAPVYARLLDDKIARGDRAYRNHVEYQLWRAVVDRNAKYLNAETLAWITATQGLAATRDIRISDRPLRQATLCHRLARQLLAYAQVGDYLSTQDGAQNLLKTMGQNWDKSCTGTQKRQALLRRYIASNAGIDIDSLPAGDSVRIGSVMLRVLLESSGIIRTHTIQRSRTSKEIVYLLTDDARELLGNTQTILESAATVRLPMVVPPRPWLRYTDYCPYLLDANASLFVRVKPWQSPSYWDFTPTDPKYWQSTLRAVNKIGAVAYRVNAATLRVAKWALQERGGGFAQFPITAPPATPPKPVDGTEEEIQEWRATVSSIAREAKRARSKALAAMGTLHWANRLAEEQALYFPHNVDTRGRVYQLCTTFGPQTDDLGKGLLMFAEGVPLRTPEGVYWFRVHGANCFGIDKIAFDERVEWVERHRQEIIGCAADPYVNSFWHAADKPMQFLAFCYEYQAFVASGCDLAYESHLPIAQDGSCSGLQHLSALGRDSVGAQATNLTCSEIRYDIYEEVLVICRQLLAADLDTEWHEHWLAVIDRNLVKRPVMTTPYGVTFRGIQQQIYEQAKSDPTRYGLDTCDMRVRSTICGVLARVVVKAIAKVVEASDKIKTWLQTVGQLAADEKKPIVYITPSGFPWVQEYRKDLKGVLRVRVPGRKSELRIRFAQPDVLGEMDRRKFKSSTPPNLIHALDAAHLVAVVNECAFPLMCVHDSFACHAANVDSMRKTLLNTFAQQYTPDLLQDFYEVMSATLDAEIPLPPARGDFEIDTVRQSSYAFS